MSDDYQSKLTPEEYRVLRQAGTEAPYSGTYHDIFEDGTYRCRACDAALFPSTAKYHSDIPGLAGWPSFDDALPGAVEFRPDDTGGMHRTEVVCTQCKSHLGHIFDDADAKTGKHYCINSVCLDLEKSDRPGSLPL